jgi:3-hydroxybutyryl-CoA dehydrogenase
MNIAIAGPGLMGSQIGAEYALGGHHVAFVARHIDRGINRVNAAFEVAASLDLWSTEEIAAAHDRVVFVPVVSDLNPDTDLFLESIIEDPAIKIEMLKEAGKRMPKAILASNTSSLSIGRLGGWAGFPKRTIGTHYWNPPLLMPLVEVVAGPETDPTLIPPVMEWLRTLGKRPVAVERDVDGFVWNRLQLALLREAVWIVEQKVATPEVVDEIVRDGLARRWRYTGPFATAALGGPQIFTRVANNLWPELSHAHELHDLARWLIDNPQELAELRARRDAGLIEDLKKDRERE